MKQYTDQLLRNYTHIPYQIWNEHLRQIKKWGIQTHTMFEWLTYITEELGSLAKAISGYEYRNGEKQRVIDEAYQVATLAIKIAEMYITQDGVNLKGD